ncbi:MAG: hypothetical protein QM765_08300 [Myxococcales bacterium]
MFRKAVLLVATTLVLGSCERAATPQATLLAAAVDLDEGIEVEKSQMVEVKVSASLATPNSLKPEALQTTAGKRLRISVQRGDLLLASYFNAPLPAPAAGEAEQILGPGGRVSNIVQKKGRAITLSVSGAEHLQRNDRVDLLSVVPDPTTRQWVGLTQVQNVVVLDPGKAEPAVGNEAFPLRRVSFLLLPEEGEMALLAARIGGLHVTVRNREDVDLQEERGRATVDTLLTGERTRALETLRSRVLAHRGPAATANEPRLAAPRPPHPLPASNGPATPVPAGTAPVPAMPGRQ